jgi:hypothetical protein
MVPIKKRRVKGVAESDTEAFFEHVGEADLYTRIVDLLHVIAEDEILLPEDKINGLLSLRNKAEELARILVAEHIE